MELPHSYNECLRNKNKKYTVWEYKVVERKKSYGGENTKPADRLSLAKTFKSALITHVKLSGREADFTLEKIKKE